MTRAADEIGTCLDLHDRGLTQTEIATRLRLPRSTVRDWINGLVPRGWDAPTCCICGQPEHDFLRLPSAYAYVLGMYLGDGSISTGARGVHRLRITLGTAYPGIIAEAIRAVNALMPGGHAGRIARAGKCVDVSSYSRAWPCLLPQDGDGRKHERRIELRGWQWMSVGEHTELFLRGLIHSDGCRFTNTGRRWCHPRYSFSNVSDDIRAIFCQACELLGLRWTAAGERTIYVSRKADVARLDEFVGPKA